MDIKKLKEFSKLKAVKITLAALLLLAFLAIFYAAAVMPHGKIAKGVSVDGIYVGKMTVQEAEAALLDDTGADAMIITVYTKSGASREFSGADIELLRNARATAEEVYKIGRKDGFFGNARTLIGLFFKPKEFHYKYTMNEDKLAEILYDFGVSINGELKNYTLNFSEDSVYAAKGTAGQSKDVSKEIEEVVKALEMGETHVLIEPKKTEPPEPDIESLYNEIYIAPQNARYEITDGKVVFFAEANGRQIDKIEAGTKIEQMKNGETVTLKLVTLRPDITLDTLNEQLFNYTLGSYSTTYSTSNRSRSSNVELAAARINGVVLAPEEIFSYNDTVGRRTAENGFKEAQIYENGETVQGLGGGVCQVSSTLYSAVLYADLKTVQRQCHSMTVGYIPKGQDATVSYGTIDYKFQNNTAYPIKIAASAKGGKLEIAIYGTKPEIQKTVKITNTVIETETPTVTETADSSLMTGNKRVISKGKTGYTVETVRTVYENGIEVKSEKMGKSVYKMVPTKVAIGTKVPAPLPTLAPTPTPVPEVPAEEPQDMGG